MGNRESGFNEEYREGLRQFGVRKPWLTVEEQIDCLKGKGINFDIYSEEDAALYLAKNHHYFRLGSYRKTFPRYTKGEKAGKFVSLDFAMLVDLAVIDMLLRQQMLPMTLDIEHFEKVRLLGRIEEEGEDGYSIVVDYIVSNNARSLNGDVTNRVKDDIRRGNSSPYISDLISRYPDYGFPAWAFMEVIAFGTFIDFYKFCANRFGDKSMQDNYYLLQKVKSMRNACAHNNCILNNLAAGTSKHRTPYELTREIGKIEGLGKDARRSRLSNDRLQEIAATLYRHKEVVSRGVYEHRAEELAGFKARMVKNLDYYAGNLQVASSFDFLGKLISAWY